MGSAVILKNFVQQIARGIERLRYIALRQFQTLQAIAQQVPLFEVRQPGAHAVVRTQSAERVIREAVRALQKSGLGHHPAQPPPYLGSKSRRSRGHLLGSPSIEEERVAEEYVVAAIASQQYRCYRFDRCRQVQHA